MHSVTIIVLNVEILVLYYFSTIYCITIDVVLFTKVNYHTQTNIGCFYDTNVTGAAPRSMSNLLILSATYGIGPTVQTVKCGAL